MAPVDEPDEQDEAAKGRAVFEAAVAEAAALDGRSDDIRLLATVREWTETIFNPGDLQDGRVYFSYQRFLISAFERCARIMQSDLPTIQE